MLDVGLNGGGHFFGCVERTVHAPGFNVLVGLGQASVDDPALLRGVLVIGRRQLGDNGNDAAGDLELYAVASLQRARRRILSGTTS